ncbi:MAG: hypothetical protein Q8Q15_02085 [bacterium]|nr:hypothetical protein [bacterium]
MAKVFLDANIFIDLIEKRREVQISDLDRHLAYISPLSIHILLYITKKKVPYFRLSRISKQFSLIPLDQDMAKLCLEGPTSDFEDNVQLYSAAEAECDFFLTEDKKLLSLKFFGKTRIVSELK